ncbi:MAG: Ig-like domain-containing protein [Clostridia bacterium]|nr:Ig-like domain-containing protein [Clostridia bacterium]
MKKRNLIAVLATCMVSCACLSVIALPTQAELAENSLNVSTIAMAPGASVRVNAAGEHADKKGIRFTMYVNQDYYESFTAPVVGVYVLPASLVEAEDMLSETTVPAAANHYYTATVEELAGDDKATVEDTYSFNAVVYGIPETAYNVQIIANGYIAEGEEGEKTFAANPVSRSVAQVASLALADGDTRTGLNDYVNGVVTESNFLLEEVSTHKYSAEKPALNKTLPENLTAIWSSSNEAVATVDKDGNITWGETLGTTTITAKLGTVTKTATATLAEPTVVTIDDTTSSRFTLNGDKSASKMGVVNATDVDATSEYKGMAQKFKSWNCATSGAGWSISNQFTAEELTAIKKDYNLVSMWFAIDLTEKTTGTAATSYLTGKASSGGYASFEDNFLSYAGASKRVYSTDEANGKWQKLTISIEEYIALVSADTGEVAVDNKVLLLGMTLEGTTLQDSSFIYVGDIIFEYETPTVVAISSATSSRFTLNGDASASKMGVVNATDVDATSEYKGMAQKFKSWNCATSGAGWSISNQFTAEELNAIKEKYNSVSMWFAFDLTEKTAGTAATSYLTGKGSGGYANFKDNFLSYAGASKRVYSTDEANGKWQKLTISIDEYIALASASTGEVAVGNKVLLLGMTLEGTTLQDSSFIYIGDIFFENV